MRRLHDVLTSLVWATFFCGNVVAVTIPTVPIGNPGNPADVRYDAVGFGSVDHHFRIGKFEVTNAQYVEFLNGVDPLGINTLALYSSSMSSSARGGIIYNSAAANASKYAAKPGRDNNPVNFVTWYDTVRFANWLHNGQGGGDTENGAYTLLGGTPTPANGNNIVRNPGATWWLPNENEWYKAAYHKNDGATGNYWDYPTATDAVPYSDQPPGSDAPDPTNTANFFRNDRVANGHNDGFAMTGSGIEFANQNYLNDVGAYAMSPSPYATFDQGGNVWEWNETIFTGSSQTSRLARGGGWGSGSISFSGSLNASVRFTVNPTDGGNDDLGFRVATVPEPRAIVVGAIAGLVLMGYGASTRSRNHGRRARPTATCLALYGCSYWAGAAPAQFTSVVDVPPFPAPRYILSNTQLNLFAGGTIASGFSAGDPAGTSTNVEVNVYGGSIGTQFGAYAGSEINFFGGSLASLFFAYEASKVNVFGGTLGTGTSLAIVNYPTSEVNIAGGVVTRVSSAGGTVNVSGGVVAGLASGGILSGGVVRQLDIASGRAFRIDGAEFRLNGELIAGLGDVGNSLPLNVPEEFVLSGVLADGTPFAHAMSGTFASTGTGPSGVFDKIAENTLTLHTTALPPIGPADISLPGDLVPRGIRGGQSLTIGDGASITALTAAPGAHINMTGGTLSVAEVAGSVVDIAGGALGTLGALNESVVNISAGQAQSIYALNRSMVNQTGGSVCCLGSAHIFIDSGSKLNLSGGSAQRVVVGNNAVAEISGDASATTLTVMPGGVANIVGGRVNGMSIQPGATIEVSRGQIGSSFVSVQGTIEISGGSFTPSSFVAGESGDIRLFGSQFLLDNLPIDGLTTPGDSLLLATRGDAVLNAILADGSPFAMALTYVDAAATLRLSVVPEPASIVLLAAAIMVGLTRYAPKRRW